MIGDRLKSLLHIGSLSGSEQSTSRKPSGSSPQVKGEGQAGVPARHSPEQGPESIRHSHGLEQFFASLEDREGRTILDLSGVSQANVTFITNLGHRLYSDDFLRSLDAAFSGPNTLEMQARLDLIETFLAETMNYPAQHFDGALVWDMLQYLGSPLLERTVARLYRIMKPGSYVLCFFCTSEKAVEVPVYTYRIADCKTLHLLPRGHRQPAQLFNNRALERLFQNFDSVKFFLTREHLREVIVRR